MVQKIVTIQAEFQLLVLPPDGKILLDRGVQIDVARAGDYARSAIPIRPWGGGLESRGVPPAIEGMRTRIGVPDAIRPGRAWNARHERS